MTAPNYQPSPLTREQVEALPGPTLLMFGASWCAHCQAVQAPTLEALSQHPTITLIQAEDGKGRPLGRSFGVKLWPTIILLKDGQELDRLVRPTQAQPIADLLARLNA